MMLLQLCDMYLWLLTHIFCILCVDIHIVDNEGRNAYMLASRYGHVECMEQAKDDGVDVSRGLSND